MADASDDYFRPSSHAEQMMKKIDAFFDRHQLCDVTLITGQQRIPAHRIVLSSASDYFAAMFTSDVLEATQEEVHMKNIDPESMFAIIRYIYVGHLEIREETVEGLLSAACLLQLDKVIDACCKFLKKQLHPSNCIGIRQFAESQGCLSLFKDSDNYVVEHFIEVVYNQEFLLLSPDEAAQLFSNDLLDVPNEETVFHALVKWAKHDLSRQQHLQKLLAFIKLPLLSPQFLADHVQNNSLFKDDLESQELVMEAMKYHLLPERRPSMQSSRTKPRKSTVGVLYAVGGMDCTKGALSIEKYDLRKDRWSQVASMNERRLQFGIAVIDDRLYVVGGRDGLKTLNTVESYDPKTKQWMPEVAMATHRHGLGVSVLEGPMYAVGGHDGWSYLSTVERWDPQSKQWSYVAPMSTPRSTVGVTVLGSKLYAVGGRDGSSCLRSAECYDPHTNKWILCSPMTRRRGGVGVAACNGFVYAVGGHDAPASNPTSSRFDCVERYDPKTDTWTIVAPISSARDAVGVCLLGDRLYAVGGFDGQQYISAVESYDAQNNEWTKVAPLSVGRAGACVVHIQSS